MRLETAAGSKFYIIVVCSFVFLLFFYKTHHTHSIRISSNGIGGCQKSQICANRLRKYDKRRTAAAALPMMLIILFKCSANTATNLSEESGQNKIDFKIKVKTERWEEWQVLWYKRESRRALKRLLYHVYSMSRLLRKWMSCVSTSPELPNNRDERSITAINSCRDLQPRHISVPDLRDLIKLN